MNRLVFLPAASVALLFGVVACGGDESTAIQTLPPIRTTTSLAPTLSTVNDNRIFYTIKPGENLNLIARSFEVPLQTLIDLNRRVISDPDNVPVGVTIEIPHDVQLIDDLPTTSETSEP